LLASALEIAFKVRHIFLLYIELLIGAWLTNNILVYKSLLGI